MKLIVPLFILFHLCSNAQEGTISGVLNNETNMPLPGATIVIKGSTNGTSTDFDGVYSITCSVGDVLVVSYVGYSDREIIVTKGLFDSNTNSKFTIKKTPVNQIKSNAYNNAIKNNTDSINIISISDAKHIYKGGCLNFNRIETISIDSSNIKLTSLKPDIFYEIGFSNSSVYHFVKKRNLYEIQKTYSQGRPFNGFSTWFGPETNEIFSFGPNIKTGVSTFDVTNFISHNLYI